jgi:hypothetical protein
MSEKLIKIILIVTGLITMLPVLQFFAPEWMLQQQALAVSDDAGRLFATRIKSSLFDYPFEL